MNKKKLRSLQLGIAGISSLALIFAGQENASAVRLIGNTISGGVMGTNYNSVGVTEVAPLRNLSLTAFESVSSDGWSGMTNPDTDRSVRLLMEKQSVTLNVNQRFGVYHNFYGTDNPDGRYTTLRSYDSYLPSDTNISSALVWFSPEGGGQNAWHWEGDLTFNKKILGVYSGFGGWDSYNTTFGLNGTDYHVASSLDPVAPLYDNAEVNDNVLSLDIKSRSGVEPIRIFFEENSNYDNVNTVDSVPGPGPTPESVPEPMSILGSGFALVFGSFLKQKARQRKAKA